MRWLNSQKSESLALKTCDVNFFCLAAVRLWQLIANLLLWLNPSRSRVFPPWSILSINRLSIHSIQLRHFLLIRKLRLGDRHLNFLEVCVVEQRKNLVILNLRFCFSLFFVVVQLKGLLDAFDVERT